ncbi:hypothetical protein KC334_g20691, partial [Hortaea werneckii]
MICPSDAIGDESSQHSSRPGLANRKARRRRQPGPRAAYHHHLRTRRRIGLHETFNGMWSTMNSLNIVSRLTTTPPPSPPRSRTSSSANIETVKQSIEGQEDGLTLDAGSLNEKLERHAQDSEDGPGGAEGPPDEKTALLEGNAQEQDKSRASRIWSLPQRVA